jgi:MFS family permease
VVIFSQDLNWLIIARALAGVGGGGIVNSVWVITSELVEIPHRAKWSQALSVTWSCSAVAGPLLGGIFTSTLCSPYPVNVSSLIESVSSKLFHFKLAMGMYVMMSSRFDNPSF